MEERIKTLRKSIEFLRIRFNELAGSKTSWSKVQVIDELVPTLFLQTELSDNIDENLVGIFKHKLKDFFKSGRNNCSFQYLTIEFEKILTLSIVTYFVDFISGKIDKDIIVLDSKEFSNLVISSYSFGISQTVSSLNSASDALMNVVKINEEMRNKTIETIKYLMRESRSKVREEVIKC